MFGRVVLSGGRGSLPVVHDDLAYVVVGAFGRSLWDIMGLAMHSI